ncbi:MAG TPA: hypothetical protein VLS27_03445 [Gammaproteobacteria bacterium]|nr:hypothetical protein [Gammaproteobacteria bacterium]
MKSLTLTAAALALALSSGTALAFECPADMKKIDAALAANPSLDSSQMAKVKELRASGEQLHKSGKHGESVEALREAMQILGIK